MAARIERARGFAVAASLLARAAGVPIVRRTLAERLADLPVRDLPLERPVRIGWNDHAIPFIEAENDTDAAVALGAVHRHLRAAQIELLRRVAAGRMAELFGPLAVELDVAIRGLAVAQTVPAVEHALPEATRRWLDGFLAGFNHHALHAPAPPEFAMLGMTAEPWTRAEFFVLARLFSADLCWPVQRRLLALRDRLEPTAWRRLWPQILRGGAPELPPADGGLEDRALEAATRAGSNAAAVAGERTARGAAILAGDPHLGLQLPNPWLAVCLSAPGLSAAGLMLPGMPFLALGRNRDIAWGGTSLHAASTDFVDLSGMDPSGWESWTETIRVRGAPPRMVRMRRSPYGPVVSDGVLFRSRRAPLGFKWMGHAPSDELSAMLGLLRARNRQDFVASLAGFGVPGQTMLYAGPDGIGRQTAAHMPMRGPEEPADIVVAPDEVDRTWERTARGDRLFGEWDPPSGFVASANERLSGPAPARVPLGYFFAADERVSRIRALLAPGAGKLDAVSVASVFRDERQPNALPVRDLLLDHLPTADGERRRDFRRALATWDGVYDARSRGALAFELLLAETTRVLIGPDALGQLETAWTTRALIAGALRQHAGAALAQAIRSALPVVGRRFRRLGTWGNAHRHRPQHPFGAVPVLGRRFRQPGFAGSGGNDTLNKTGHPLLRRRHVIRFGATSRYLFDLADVDANEVVLFGGQDGWLGSANFADQVPLWRRGRGVALPLRPETARSTFRHVTFLRPD